jgi:hypothetical protein
VRLEMPLDTTSETSVKRCDANCRTSIRGAIFCAGEPRDATGHDDGKPTQIVATPDVGTPT